MTKRWRKNQNPAERLDPHRKFFDERGVSPVIAVILMVAITVVLAATLYLMVYQWIVIDAPPPKGVMEFDETDPDAGSYVVRLIQIDDEVSHKDLSVTITDISTNHSAFMGTVKDGGIASCGPGKLNVTYQDINKNNKLGVEDLFYVHNGGEGDIIVLTYTKGTSAKICDVVLT